MLRKGMLMVAILQVAGLLLMEIGCNRTGPLISSENASQTEAAPDLWAPWRRSPELKEAGYAVDSNTLQVIPLDGAGKDGVRSFSESETERRAAPFKLDLSGEKLSETSGIELSVTFRVLQIPPGRLDSSHSLALLSLIGDKGRRSFWLHAYSGNSGFMLNGIDKKWSEVRLLRGAAVPHSAVRWDTQWHTVKLAWCNGRFAVRWDGLPILYVLDPSIDFNSFNVESVNPGINFHAIEFKPIEIRKANFSR